MHPPKQHASLAEFDRIIRSTRAAGDPQVMRAWNILQRDPGNAAVREWLERMLARHVEDAIRAPPLLLDQPGWDSDVWQGDLPIGLCVDTGVPVALFHAELSCGGLLIIAGPSRGGKSTMLVRLICGLLAVCGTVVTVFDPMGAIVPRISQCQAVRALALEALPWNPLCNAELVDAVIADLSEVYGLRMSRNDLVQAARGLAGLYHEAFDGAVPFTLANLAAWLREGHHKNRFDRNQSYLRTVLTTLDGMTGRWPTLDVARGIDPPRDIFDQHSVLVSGGLREVRDHRFATTCFMRSLMAHLENTATTHDQLRHVVVFDDAIDLFHHSADQASSTGSSPLVEMATKIGKLGVLMVVVVQNLSEISHTLLANASGFALAGAFSSDVDLAKARGILGLDRSAPLASLPRGQAILRLPGLHQGRPVLVKLEDDGIHDRLMPDDLKAMTNEYTADLNLVRSVDLNYLVEPPQRTSKKQSPASATSQNTPPQAPKFTTEPSVRNRATEAPPAACREDPKEAAASGNGLSDNATKVFLSVVNRPLCGNSERVSVCGLSQGGFSRAVKELQSLGLVTEVRWSRHRHLVLTPAGEAHLRQHHGLTPPLQGGKGGPEHRLAVHLIASLYKTRGMKASIEVAVGPGRALVDLLVENPRTGARSAVEFATGESNEARNLLKDIEGGGLTDLVFVFPRKAVLEKWRKRFESEAETAQYLDKVRLVLISTIIKELTA